jgi:branched-subunit amino acid transport protein
MMWLVIVAVGLGSLGFRLGPLLLLQRLPVGERGERVLRHAATAAITALIVNSIRQGTRGDAAVPLFAAVGVATVVAARGWSMLRLLLLGGAVYTAATVALHLAAR